MKYLFLVLVLAFTPPALSQSVITDQFGRTITQNADGVWSSSGVTVGPTTPEAALSAFNGMAPPGYTPPAPPAPTKIATLAFLKRLSSTERQTIITVARTNAMVQDLYNNLLASIEVDVTDGDTVAGVTMIEQAGLLASGRATQILNLAQSSP